MKIKLPSTPTDQNQSQIRCQSGEITTSKCLNTEEYEPQCVCAHSCKGKSPTSGYPDQGVTHQSGDEGSLNPGKYPWTVSRFKGRVSGLKTSYCEEGWLHLVLQQRSSGTPVRVSCGHSDELEESTDKR